MMLMKQVITISKYAAIAISTTVLSIVLVTSLLLFTHLGNQAIIKITKQFEPRLSIDLIDGTIFNSPVYENISWLDDETAINIDSANYQFDWSCLRLRVCLKEFNIDGANIVIAEQSEDTPPETITQEEESAPIDIPIKVIIDSITLSNFKFVMGDLSVDLDSIALSADAFQKDVSLSSQIRGLLVTLPNSSNHAVVADNDPITVTNVKKRINFKIDALPAILTTEMLPRIALPINLTVQPINIDEVKVIQDNETLFQLNSLQSAFTFKETQLSITQFLLDIPETALNLVAKVDLVGDYPLEIKVDGEIKEVKQLEPNTLLSGVNFNLNSQGSLSNLTSELFLSNKIDLQLHSHLDLFSENFPHSLNLDWQNIKWPLSEGAVYQSPQGSFSSEGSLLDYHINLMAEYTVTDLPSGKVTLTTKGDLEKLKIESLKVETLSGDVDFSGLLTWADELKWLGQLQVNNIDLQDLDSAYDGQLSGEIEQQITLALFENSEPEWHFDFPILSIKGALLSRPLSLDGRVSGNDKEGVTFDKLTVKNADNIFIVNGVLAEENNLTVALDVKDISHALLGAQGQIQGNVWVKGPNNTLQVTSQLNAQDVSYESYKLEGVKLDSSVILTEKPQLTLGLSANSITIEDQFIDDIEVHISNRKVPETNTSSTNNNYYRHQIEFLLNSEMLSTDLVVHLTQTDDTLLTNINEAALFLPHQSLTLTAPFELISQPEMVSISAHCWQAKAEGTMKVDDAGKICIEKLDIGESGQAIVSIDSYLLSNVNPHLHENFKLAGAVSANADVSWLNNGKPTFNIDVLSDDLLVKINADSTSDTFINYPMEKFSIKAIGNEEKVEMDTAIFADNFIDMTLKGMLYPYKQEPSIDSVVNINIPDFSLLLPLIPQLEVLKGQLASQLTISGNLQNPAINGSVNIQDGEVSHADLPMKITELHSKILINDTNATLEAAFNSSDTNTIVEKVADIPLLTDTLNIFDKSLKKVSETIRQQPASLANIKVKAPDTPGVAYMQGHLDWSNELSGDIRLYAHKLEIYDYGKVDLLLSPDIHIQVDEAINIKGELLVDKGKIVVKEVPEDAISPSKDVIVIDVEKETVGQNLPIIIDLSVDMGDKFQIVALGLDSFIKGKLLIKKRLKKDLSINGKLTFVDGSYRAFGQQLVLQKSRVSFHGSPETPNLSIEAIRDPEKIADGVTAGVRVTGPPDELELVIFSDPAMSQQEALSYLTRGQAINGDSGGSGTMANMLIDMAAGQSDGVISTIGEGVGIKDLSLSSSGSGDEQSVGVRGEIAPGIEISYGVGVFDTFSIFAIRYEMFERFYLEASSGVDQAIDAYYEWGW